MGAQLPGAASLPVAPAMKVAKSTVVGEVVEYLLDEGTAAKQEVSKKSSRRSAQDSSAAVKAVSERLHSSKRPQALPAKQLLAEASSSAAAGSTLVEQAAASSNALGLALDGLPQEKPPEAGEEAWRCRRIARGVPKE